MATMPTIDSLVPHRLPMRLVDEVLAFDAERATITCGATMRASPLAPSGRAGAVVSLEMMAQAAAACTGLIEAGQGEAKRGFLVSVPSLVVCGELAAGDDLEIRATRISASGNTASFECSVVRAGEPSQVASARLLVVKESR